MPALNANAQFVLAKRYLKKNERGEVIETADDMFKRVSRAVAKADEKYGDPDAVADSEEKFFRIMAGLDFLPNSPTLMNAGRQLGQLSACFVLPIEDSIESIFETLKNTAIIHKSGGGTGFSFSRIRPANDKVKSTRGISSGPISFMRIFDATTETIKQGGARRGANMAVLRIDHPDIEGFISAKKKGSHLNNFNLSVALTEDFMEKVRQNVPFALINPHTGLKVRELSAGSIFDKIVDSAWENGEPGILFIDRINRSSTLPRLGPIEATNPCGEQPLLAYESCNLGSINLSRFVDRGAINYERMGQVVAIAVHFLDNVIDVNKYPLREIEKLTLANRKIGLGVMGFADMLIKLGIAYDSQRAAEIADEVMAFINQAAKEASIELARERGNFPNYQGSIFDDPKTPFMRNATHTTIAPTGTISIIAGCSSGIEPLFALRYARHILDGQQLEEVHPLLIEALERDKSITSELKQEIMASGMIRELAGVPESLKEIFVTAMEVLPEAHIRIQAAFQRHTDNAVSKTINFPANATPADIKRAYWLAYEAGLKGLTIYRYGSRAEQVLRLQDGARFTNGLTPRPRPGRTHGLTERIKAGCGNLYVTVNSDPQGICEVFASMGKTGGCASSQVEAIGRLVSLALRSGVSLSVIGEELAGIRCPSPIWQNGEMVLSCPDAVAKVIGNVIGTRPASTSPTMGACPDCGGTLKHEEGCIACHSCGFSRCE